MSKASRPLLLPLPLRASFPRFPILQAIAPLFFCLGTTATTTASEPPVDPLAPQPSVAGALSVVERSIAQEQGSWVVDYTLKFTGATNIVVSTSDVMLKVDAWVSNSRVAAHSVPKLSSVSILGTPGLTALADVVSSNDEMRQCRERATLQVWPDDPSSPVPPLPSTSTSSSTSSHSSTAAAPSSPERPNLLTLHSGKTVRARIKLDHVHLLHGDYNPLLGERTVDLQLGTATVRDIFNIDREQYVAQAKNTWPTPPEDRRDDHHFVSAPDSLHLEAHVPGNQYYRFPERPIRYGTRMRLRYTYFIAEGTEGYCRATVAQYKELPTTYKTLSEGGHEECLKTLGKWVKVERIFKTESEATTLSLDFRIVTNGADVGEMWVDDISLEPYGETVAAGP